MILDPITALIIGVAAGSVVTFIVIDLIDRSVDRTLAKRRAP